MTGFPSASLPPTDELGQAEPGEQTWRAILVVLAALLATALLLTPARETVTRPIRRR